MTRRDRQLRQRGVSLIEAMIALAVMGFGMLAIVGVQTTLRYNADISRQRSEATRIAEQEIETVRNFSKVNVGGTAGDEFDAIQTEADQVIDQANTKFTLKRQVVTNADSDRKMITATVTWKDRSGETQRVTINDMVTRVDPMLSGFVKAARPLTALGRRNGRHASIPTDAVNVPGDDSKSIFLPPNGSGVGWVFDNATGAITHTCTAVVAVDDSTMASNCTILKDSDGKPMPAQLVSGQIRFNLRGATSDFAGGAISILKPAGNGDSAWVIAHDAPYRLKSICPVSPTAATADLAPADVVTGCKSANVPLAPFSPVDTGSLTPADSEYPQWPTLPATVKLDTSWANRSVEEAYFTCYSNYQSSTLAHADTSASPARTEVNYFCIVTGAAAAGWGGRTIVVPLAFTDTFTGGAGATWEIGTTAGTYRVCRYTQALSDYTDNDDHPSTYSVDKEICASKTTCQPVRGNLINQNFLVVAGTKACPEETAAVNPAGGNLVNSNTRQHQPLP